MDDEKELGTDYFLIAHIDLAQVQFGHSSELRFNYVHQSDGWDQLTKRFEGRRGQARATAKAKKGAKKRRKKAA